MKNFKNILVIFVTLVILNKVSLAEDSFHLKPINWNELFAKKKELVGKKVSIKAFYTYLGFYKDELAAKSLSRKYLVFPFYGDVTEDFINNCYEKDLIVEGVIFSHNESEAPRIRKVTRLTPSANPDYDCLAQISDFKN